ncbi:MAG: hypothetical protein ACRDPW_03260, partial [Mycobacteriales bacterium]
YCRERDLSPQQKYDLSLPIQLTFRTVLAQAFATGVAPGSFRGDRSMGPRLEDTAGAFLTDGVYELTDADSTVLSHPVLQPLVARAASLVDALSAAGNPNETRTASETPATPEHDTRFMLRKIRDGLQTGAVMGVSALAPASASC